MSLDGGGMLQTHGLKGEMPHEHLQSLWASWTVSHVCLAIFGFGLVDVFPQAYVSVHHAPQCYMKCIWKKGIVLSQVKYTGTYKEQHQYNLMDALEREYLSSRDWGERIGGAQDGLVIYHRLGSHQGHWPHLAHRRRKLQSNEMFSMSIVLEGSSPVEKFLKG